MIVFRRGVGSRSRNPQMPRLRSAVRSGRLSPRSASERVDRSVYSAAATMIQRRTGWARLAMPILTGEMTEVSHSANALMTTTNRPRVENSSRPVRATRTGRAKRLTSTRIPAQIRNPTIPTPWSSTIGLESGPNGNGWATSMRLRNRMMIPKQDRVDHDLDDESAHAGPPTAIRARRSHHGRLPFIVPHRVARRRTAGGRRLRSPNSGPDPWRCDRRIRVWIGRDDRRAWRRPTRHDCLASRWRGACSRARNRPAC